MPTCEQTLLFNGVLTIIQEDDKLDDSILYYDPTFFKSESENLKKKLFEIQDWRGDAKDTLNWVPPRLQRWSQLDGMPFCKTWPVGRF